MKIIFNINKYDYTTHEIALNIRFLILKRFLRIRVRVVARSAEKAWPPPFLKSRRDVISLGLVSKVQGTSVESCICEETGMWQHWIIRLICDLCGLDYVFRVVIWNRNGKRCFFWRRVWVWHGMTAMKWNKDTGGIFSFTPHVFIGRESYSRKWGTEGLFLFSWHVSCVWPQRCFVFVWGHVHDVACFVFSFSFVYIVFLRWTFHPKLQYTVSWTAVWITSVI